MKALSTCVLIGCLWQVSAQHRLTTPQQSSSPSTDDDFPPCTRPTQASPQVTTSSLPGGQIVLCDTQTDGGGWVIIQRRFSNRTSFAQNWVDYERGFGRPWRDFWLGLRTIHRLCNVNSPCQLRIDMSYAKIPECDTACNWTHAPYRPSHHYYATYSNFSISGPSDLYRLTLSGYRGNAGDAMTGSSLSTYNNDQMPFSTADADHDGYAGNCAVASGGGGWWWSDYCGDAGLNGVYGDTRRGQGLVWYPITAANDTLSLAEIKVRRTRRDTVTELLRE